MNTWFLSAARLSALAAITPVFGGGPEFHQPMLASGQDLRFKAQLAAYMISLIDKSRH